MWLSYKMQKMVWISLPIFKQYLRKMFPHISLCKLGMVLIILFNTENMNTINNILYLSSTESKIAHGFTIIVIYPFPVKLQGVIYRRFEI